MTVLDALTEIERNARAGLLRCLGNLQHEITASEKLVAANGPPHGKRIEHKTAAVVEAIEIWTAIRTSIHRYHSSVESRELSIHRAPSPPTRANAENQPVVHRLPRGTDSIPEALCSGYTPAYPHTYSTHSENAARKVSGRGD